MKYLLISLLMFSARSGAGQVIDDNCKSPVSGTGIVMMDEMRNSMQIDINSIEKDKTTTELLFNEPVSNVLATQFANQSYIKMKGEYLSVKDYVDIYTEDNARNLIIKFTFKNNLGKENVFIVSSLVNDYECSMRFNGYIIVKREF